MPPVPPPAPSPWRRRLGPLLALAIVGAGLLAARSLRQRQQAAVQAVQRQAGGPTRSGRISGPSAALGGRDFNLPHLDRVRVVVPDRPHRPEEAHDTRARRDGRLGRVRSFTVSTGALGLRGGDPPPGGRRVLVLGDSTAQGWGVDGPESWPAQLQARLREGGGLFDNNDDIIVLNAGYPACPIATMGAVCTTLGPALAPELVLWMRRPDSLGPGPVGEVADLVQACAAATGAPVWVLLPPVSTFDLARADRIAAEGAALRARLPPAVPVIELTGPVRALQEAAGRGHVLRRAGDRLQIVDTATGAVVLDTPATGTTLPDPVLQAFERDTTLREHAFFDEGHLDATGQRWLADWLAPQIRPVLGG